MKAAALALFLGLLAGAGALAEERIGNYTIDVSIRADGSLDVTEQITVRAEGSNIRRGIYRDFPTRYRDRYGNRVVVDLDVLGVERNGASEPWFTETKENGIRINTGNDNFLPVPAEYTYTLRYRTTRQLGFFADHDELYWNAIGTGWDFPIDRGEVDVHLPAATPAEQMHAEGYTGYQGSKGTDYAAELVAPGHAHWRLTRALEPREGFTIVLTFPKGMIRAPGGAQRAMWLLKDNRGVLIALVGLVLMILYCVREWSRVGRDPQKGVVIARYEPPAGLSPASLRYLRRMGYDMRCFSSEVLALAVAGCLRIVRDKGFFKDSWKLERASESGTRAIYETQRTLLGRIFAAGSELVLEKKNATKVSAARQAHSSALEDALQPQYFKRNTGSVTKAFLIGAAGIAIAYFAADGFGIPAIVAVAVAMVLALLVFIALVRAPTAEGRKLLDEIEGLKLYLSVAERDELARMQSPDAPPPIDAKRYETLLPYAVALEVEDAWTEKFTLAVGAAAAAAATNSIGWYRGGDVGDLGSLSRAVGSSLTSQIASAATPPGSSSGSGGGGSSGGGGGGGGGGGR
jgi:Predicted membrane protein (DUF2207) N-terminal domain/Predicted membrane protein (DUF2207) C-terminal domain